MVAMEGRDDASAAAVVAVKAAMGVRAPRVFGRRRVVYPLLLSAPRF
jgi:hypothetical protein